jgi:hypothetical protein
VTGTGALNIDRCRTATPEVLSGGGGKLWSHYRDGTTDRAEPKVNAGRGRWPANFVLAHLPKCHVVGVRQVHPGGGGTARREKGVSNQVAYGGNIGRLPKGTPDLGYVGEGGLETVTAWQCASGCPIAALDAQSGTLTSGRMKAGQQRVRSHGKGGYHDNMPDTATLHDIAGDSGTASRFFTQVTSLDELLAHVQNLILPLGGQCLDG